MTKINWTCKQCGMWHSRPKDDSLPTILSSCDGIQRVPEVLAYAASRLQWVGANPEERVMIESHPVDRAPFWADPSAHESKELRVVIISAAPGQELRLLCRMCGFDSTDLLKPQEPKVLMDSISYV